MARKFHSEVLFQAIKKLARNDNNGVKIMKELEVYDIFSLVFNKGKMLNFNY